MPWSALGWLLARFLMSCCALPWFGEAQADALGRACRAKLPWRLSSATARWMASRPVAPRADVSWLAFACAASVGAMQAWAMGDASVAALGVFVGMAPALLLTKASSKSSVARSRGRLWLAAVSSSELCQSMGPVPAGPRSGQGWESRHPGFKELASRLLTLSPQTPAGQLARRRLVGMCLACSGSEVAARWLWARRRAKRSMALRSRDLASEMGSSGEGWEISCAMMALGAKVSSSFWNLSMDAADIDESSLPLLWVKEPSGLSLSLAGEGFQAELVMEIARIWCQKPQGRWGWSEIGGESDFKKRVATCLRERSVAWMALLEAAPYLIEAREIGLALPEKKSGAAPPRL